MAAQVKSNKRPWRAGSLPGTPPAGICDANPVNGQYTLAMQNFALATEERRLQPAEASFCHAAA